MAKLRKCGGYRELRSFQIATVVYDGTYRFCERFVNPRSRTSDQMVQAARSGRQNIAEGSRASGTSSQTELRLVNVARASLEELLLDFEDFLRHRGLRQWGPESPEARAVREVGRQSRENAHGRSDLSDRSDRGCEANEDGQAATRLADDCRYDAYRPWLDHEDPAVRANALIRLIHQANYLLDQQLEAVERRFVEEGGYSEQLAALRLVERDRQRGEAPTHRGISQPSNAIPPCPKCGRPMALRTARQGNRAGRTFWGCTGYPACKGLVEA